MKTLRWIAVPFMLLIGMVLGNLLGHAVDRIGVGLIMSQLTCGIMSSMGAIYLPVKVAPGHKGIVVEVCFWVVIALSVCSAVIVFSYDLYSGKELLAYLVSLLGGVGGAIYCKINKADLETE